MKPLFDWSAVGACEAECIPESPRLDDVRVWYHSSYNLQEHDVNGTGLPKIDLNLEQFLVWLSSHPISHFEHEATFITSNINSRFHFPHSGSRSTHCLTSVNASRNCHETFWLSIVSIHQKPLGTSEQGLAFVTAGAVLPTSCKRLILKRWTKVIRGKQTEEERMKIGNKLRTDSRKKNSPRKLRSLIRITP